MQVVILNREPGASVELCGITLRERLLRTLARVEATHEIAPESSELHLTLPDDVVWDARLLELLLAQMEPCVLLDHGRLTGAFVSHGGEPEADARVIEIAELPTYSLNMRRHLPILCLPAPTTADECKKAERRILDAAQKGSQDLPAIVHGPIETFFVSHLCRTSITPNQLTAVCNVVAWAAALFFAAGYLGTGTLCALAVGVLDGLDGKQARVKVETSEAGKLEHWFDTFYELAWALALAFSLWHTGLLPTAWWYLVLLLVAEGVDGLAKLSVIRRYGRLIDELTPLDAKIRLLGGRRNIYIWIFAIGLLLGTPASAFVVIAWWEAATALVHVARALWTIQIRPLDFTHSSRAA